MLSSHSTNVYYTTKTPGRALANRGENLGVLPVKGKNTYGVPRTPFQPSSALLHKVFKDQKPGTTARPLADKTPLPNRIGTTLFQTPFTQKKEDLKSENDDDFDEIEFMAPNTLDLPYQPPLDFELPDYKVLGKRLRNLAHSCPFDDSPSPPEPDLVISDIAISTWDMFKLPPLSLEDDPFHKARAELSQASGKGKTTVPISKSRPEAATTGGSTLKPTRTAVNKRTIPKSTLVNPSYHKSTVSLSSRPVGVVSRVATTSTIRRPQTAIDMNKKRDKPVGVQGALMLVKNDNLRDNGDVLLGEDFLFNV